MEHFNEALYNKAINDFNGIVSRYQASLGENLQVLEIGLTDELWQDFVKNGSRKIKEIAHSKLNASRGIYSAAPNHAPVSLALTQIENLYSLMVNSYSRPMLQAYLIPLASCSIDKTISQDALDNLKEHCTSRIDDNVYKAIQSFSKAYAALNTAFPNCVEIESRLLVQNDDGTLGINYYNL